VEKKKEVINNNRQFLFLFKCKTERARARQKTTEVRKRNQMTALIQEEDIKTSPASLPGVSSGKLTCTSYRNIS